MVQHYLPYEWVGGCQTSRKKRYVDVWFNIISLTSGWVGVKRPEKSVT